MRIDIAIECDTIAEFLEHLNVIEKKAKIVAKNKKLNSNRDAFAKSQWDDQDYYGSHTVEITDN